MFFLPVSSLFVAQISLLLSPLKENKQNPKVTKKNSKKVYEDFSSVVVNRLTVIFSIKLYRKRSIGLEELKKQ